MVHSGTPGWGLQPFHRHSLCLVTSLVFFERHLINRKCNPFQVFDTALVRRVDPSLGLLLELPSEKGAEPTAGYVHVSNVSDDKIEKLEKAFKHSQKVGAASRAASACSPLDVFFHETWINF